MSKRARAIPPHIREQADAIIAAFNQNVIKDPTCYYVARYEGRNLFLDRHNFGPASPMCRLRFTGRMDDWDFAIYKYSREAYDPDEWMFPGVELVDGTIEGTMKACLEAYPLDDFRNKTLLGKLLHFFFGRRK